MEGKGNQLDIENLTKILSSIQNLYYKKKEQLEELQLEIRELKDVLNNLSQLLSNKSFQSAEEIYNQALKHFQENETEDYFKDTVPKEKVKDTNIKRKIFSKDEKDLLCVLNFFDFNKIEIKFVNPEQRKVQETSEDFISIFLRGALIKIKEINPEMDLTYQYFKDTDIIEKIDIFNLRSINEYDLITAKIRQLLANESTLN